MPAQAATQTDTMTVQVTIVPHCEVSATNLDFGNYNPLDATDLNGQTTISVTCTKGTPFTATLDAGTYAGGSTNFTSRKMQGLGANPFTLNYQLYTDSGRGTVWGDGTTGGTGARTGTGLGPTTPVSLIVYGTIPAQQNVKADTYVDPTVTATVTY